MAVKNIAVAAANRPKSALTRIDKATGPGYSLALLCTKLLATYEEFGDVAQVVRAGVSYALGRWFKSTHRHHFRNTRTASRRLRLLLGLLVLF